MWQGLNGKLLAEEGIEHTNCELHKGLFDMGTDIKLWKKFKKVSKIDAERGRALPGGPLVFQAGYHSCKTTFKTHPKHILFRYENRPYIRVFAYVFLNLCVMSFPKFVNLTQTIPFFVSPELSSGRDLVIQMSVRRATSAVCRPPSMVFCPEHISGTV